MTDWSMSSTIRFLRDKESKRSNTTNKLIKSTGWKSSRFKNWTNCNFNTKLNAKLLKKTMLTKFSYNRPGLASLAKWRRQKTRSSTKLSRQSKTRISRRSSKSRFSLRNNWLKKKRSSENIRKSMRERRRNTNNSKRDVRMRQKRTLRPRSNRINQASKSLKSLIIRQKMRNWPKRKY